MYIPILRSGVEMNELLTKISEDLSEAMIKRSHPDKIGALRMVLSESARTNKKLADMTVEEVEAIIRKLIKSEMIVLEYSGFDEAGSVYINTLSNYIPKQMSKAQIETWIMDNIDISQFNPKMKAMGSIMKELKGKADGNDVKKILTEWS